MPVKIYKNTSKKPIRLPQLDLELKSGEQVSVSGDFMPPVILENYPGLIDVEAEGAAEKSKDEGNSK